jgi:negative regulator of replication initiation
MSDNRDPTPPAGAGVFSAADIKRRMAEIEAAKAAEEMRRMQAQEEQQKAVMAEFHKPPDRTADQLLRTVMQLVNRAAERGQSEVQVYRFPNTMCTDRGRRINNSEAGWEQTLEGRPKLGYEFWRDHLQPLGFGLKAEVLEYPGGMPGDIGFFLTWK